jgi:3-hydroxyisobutyrate dehydrogenase-like beta-hydroxyacid dehydrogenase
MGTPMIDRLHGAGYHVSVVARRSEVEATYASRGIRTVARPADVADSDVVIVCVKTEAQVRKVTTGPEGVVAKMLPGSTLIVHTTCSPSGFDQVIAAASERGIEVVDAPLDGVPPDFAAGRGKLYLGATDESIENLQELLGTYASLPFRCGGPGYGQRNKVLNILLTAAHTHLVDAAIEFAAVLGLEPRTALEAVAAGGSSSTSILGYSIIFSDNPKAFLDSIRPFLKEDVSNYDAFLAELKAPAGLLVAAARQAAMNDLGDGAEAGTSRLQTWDRSA